MLETIFLCRLLMKNEIYTLIVAKLFGPAEAHKSVYIKALENRDKSVTFTYTLNRVSRRFSSFQVTVLIYRGMIIPRTSLETVEVKRAHGLK